MKNNLKNFLKSNNADTDDEMYLFGYKKLGPFLYAFTCWLVSEIKKSGISFDKIFFFSRDGYLPIKAFNILLADEGLQTMPKYAYFSRNSIRKCLLCECSDYIDSLKYLSVVKFISWQELLEYYGLEEERIDFCEEFGFLPDTKFEYATLENNHLIEAFYNKYEYLIINNSKKNANALKQYLIQIDMHGDCAIMDIGWHGGMQFYLQKLIDQEGLDIRLKGYYIGTQNRYPFDGEMNGFVYDDNNTALRKKVLCFFGVLEKFFQSCEGSAVGYKIENNLVRPILARYEYEGDTSAIGKISKLQNGALDFVSRAAKRRLVINNKEVFNSIIKFGKNPTLKELKMFKFLYNIDGVKYYYLPQKGLFKYKIKEFIYDLNASPWKTGFLKATIKVPLPYYSIYRLFKK